MEQTSNVNVYHSEYRFLIASAILTFAFTMFIAPTFIRWWELDHSVTLDPIEIAKAFDTPLLQGSGSNAPLSELIRTMGPRELRLGDTETHTGTPMEMRELKLADPVEVTMPRAGVVYA